MTDFETTFEAVFHPHRATNYFLGPVQSPFQPHSTHFRAVNAWWCAELSRLVYQRHADEPNHSPVGTTRTEFLRPVGFEETQFVNRGGSQASVVRPAGPGDPAYLIVVFRGTDDLQAWTDFNLQIFLADWPEGGKVHIGFKEAFENIWDALDAAVPAELPVVYTGHSLGGALAALAASRRPPTQTYTFGSPKVGDGDFGRTVAQHRCFRVVNNRDFVTEIPPLGLQHVGTRHYIDHSGRIVEDPTDLSVFADRLNFFPAPAIKRNLWDGSAELPQKLLDHAPVNYVAHLARVSAGT